MKAFILAAGFGTRMQELTRNLPKPLLPVGGYPLIYYSLYWLYRWQVQACVINLHYLGDLIQQRLQNFPHFPLHFSTETEILGTAGGIRHAMPHMLSYDDEFLVLNPDTILLPEQADDPRAVQLAPSGSPSATGAVAQQKAPDLSHLYLAPREGTEATGLELDATGRLHFQEAGAYFYMGLSLLHGSLLRDLPDPQFAALGPLWRQAAQKERLTGQIFHGQILDAGTRSAYLQIRDQFPLPAAERPHWQEFLQGWN